MVAAGPVASATAVLRCAVSPGLKRPVYIQRPLTRSGPLTRESQDSGPEIIEALEFAGNSSFDRINEVRSELGRGDDPVQ